MLDTTTRRWEDLYEAGREAMRERDVARAENALAHALDVAGDDTKLAATLNLLARVYASQQRFFLAIPLLHRLLDMQERTLGTSHAQLVGVLTNLAEMYERSGDHGDELEIRERVLAIRVASGETDSPIVTKLRERIRQLSPGTPAPVRARRLTPSPVARPTPRPSLPNEHRGSPSVPAAPIVANVTAAPMTPIAPASAPEAVAQAPVVSAPLAPPPKAEPTPAYEAPRVRVQPPTQVMPELPLLLSVQHAQNTVAPRLELATSGDLDLSARPDAVIAAQLPVAVDDLDLSTTPAASAPAYCDAVVEIADLAYRSDEPASLIIHVPSPQHPVAVQLPATAAKRYAMISAAAGVLFVIGFFAMRTKSPSSQPSGNRTAVSTGSTAPSVVPSAPTPQSDAAAAAARDAMWAKAAAPERQTPETRTPSPAAAAARRAASLAPVVTTVGSPASAESTSRLRPSQTDVERMSKAMDAALRTVDVSGKAPSVDSTLEKLAKPPEFKKVKLSDTRLP
jgi:tetratricopeptide (TPR) repeat protein